MSTNESNTPLRFVNNFPISKLQVDTEYQRKKKIKQIKKIARNLDEIALAAVIVAEREDGTYWIVDGQQRVEALKKIGRKTAPCLIFKSTTGQYESEKFSKINSDQTRLKPLEEFKAKLAANRPMAIAIRKCLESKKFRISGIEPIYCDESEILGIIKAIKSIEVLTTKYKLENVGYALKIIGEECLMGVTNKNKIYTSGELIGGLCLFLYVYKRYIIDNEKEFRYRFSKENVAQLISEAKRGGYDYFPVANKIAEMYNRGRTSRKLDLDLLSRKRWGGSYEITENENDTDEPNVIPYKEKRSG